MRVNAKNTSWLLLPQIGILGLHNFTLFTPCSSIFHTLLPKYTSETVPFIFAYINATYMTTRSYNIALGSTACGNINQKVSTLLYASGKFTYTVN